MQVNRPYYRMAQQLFSTMVAGLLIGLWPGGGRTMSVAVVAAETHPPATQASAIQGAAADRPADSPSIARGMGKEAVRSAWGEPEEIRKIRTCFGWQEEWVYRGDPKRFGASERVLLFDEGEVVTEIK